ncbi:MAG: hypothetical protein WBA57_18835 [Elainellaceae cyanobacterium]
MTPSPDQKRIPKRDPNLSAMEAMSAYYQTTEKRFDSVNDALTELSLNVVQLTSQMKELAKQQQKTSEHLETLGKRIDGHLAVAKEQGANISELTKLVATQAQTVQVLINRAS